MGHIYFVRHGQTVWNVENKICGATDIELTKLGHAQADELGRRLAEEVCGIDLILYSPLVRAAETARHISEATGIPRRAEPRLTEQNFGKYESTLRDGEAFGRDKQNFINSYGGGETMLKLCHRVYSLLDELKKSEMTCLLVAHNGIARAVKSYFCDMSNEEFAAYGIDNCEILRFDF
ncbi:MAG: histidine phosphatase family protein [Butyrivibrio sp.]|nr:histidine phosphatase family protein [Butyrivibrio sp.]